MQKTTPITTDSEWTFDLIDEYYSHIQRIAVDKYGLDVYPNQIEIITSEQMLDCYSSVGMPINYHHWSFGKQFSHELEVYKRGYMGLAYEIVINSNPVIAYLMEENTMMMQILVMAHACMGHNYFFKNNYLFKQWTDADAIIDYLSFAKKYVSECEEKYGEQAVEEVLDSCHALQVYGVDKYKHPRKLSVLEEEERTKERNDYVQQQLNLLWNTIPVTKGKPTAEDQNRFPSEPQENLLYFIEKNAPNLETWKRELIRIVRKTSQYFYPQRQTQVMNEGTATMMHYHIMYDLFDEGLIGDGYMLEFLASHTGVVRQPEYHEQGFSGINPYTLGFNMFMDIKRMCMEPTDEDREWFPDIAGNGDWISTFRDIVCNYKDESFIQQFLSPKVMRDMKLFSIVDDEKDTKLEVTAIHNDSGYRKLRESLSKQYNIGYSVPDIQVYNVDRWGDRTLSLVHNMVNERPLDSKNLTDTLKHVHRLWGYNVELVQHCDGKPVNTHSIGESTELLELLSDFST